MTALSEQRVPVEMVATGPVRAIIKKGDEVDLTRLPAHQSGVRDGGPFITAGLAVTKDPDAGTRNLSFHRLMLKGPRKTGALLYPRHAHTNYPKYEARGEPMPIAVFIGHHPLVYMAAATTGPYGMDEFEVAGAYPGQPVRLVKCETVDLEVPADAEIVLEGHVLPRVREEEGPFAEFQDHYVVGSGKNPVVEYQALTMRSDPIFKAIQFVTHNALEAAYLADGIHLLTPRRARLARSMAVDVPRDREMEDPRVVATARGVVRALEAPRA